MMEAIKGGNQIQINAAVLILVVPHQEIELHILSSCSSLLPDHSSYPMDWYCCLNQPVHPGLKGMAPSYWSC
jgi:hypothetical protein